MTRARSAAAASPSDDRDGIVVVPMKLADLPGAAEVERRSAPRPRSENVMRSDFGTNRLSRYCVARHVEEGSPAVVGYACLWLQADEAHVVMIAVLPEWRRNGIGGRLLQWLIAEAQALGTSHITLEVRESNASAMRLYAAHGFDVVGSRSRYYPDSGETAVIMTAPLVRR